MVSDGTSSSSLLRTPPRPSLAKNRGGSSTSFSTPYMTPSKSMSSSRRSTTARGATSRHKSAVANNMIPRMSPMPGKTTAGTPSTKTPFYTPRRSLYSSGTSNTTTTTPGSSTNDRFIPSRRKMNMDLCRRTLLTGEKKRRREEESSNPSEDGTNHNDASPNNNNNNNSNNSNNNNNNSNKKNPQETPLQKEFKRRMLSSLCNVPLEHLSEDAQPRGILSFGAPSSSSINSIVSNHSSHAKTENNNLLAASSSSLMTRENPFAHDTLRNVLQRQDLMDPVANHYAVSKKIHRKVSAAPTRILDAPDIVNDYYLQLISWGKDNILAVALAQSVYLWNATSGDIQHLVSTEAPDDYITSVSWCTIPGRTKYIAVGTNANVVEIYDAEVLRKVRTLAGHSGRVCSLAWSHQWLSSGARDSLILQHDIRCHHNIVSTYEGHEQEVCGLKWNEEGSVLASGGNENYLCLWDAAMSGRSSFSQRRQRSSLSENSIAPRLILTQHKAAVKALDWCPFHRGLLASGGGTADRTIKFWNSSSGAMLNSIDTGSQVCSVLWSKHQRELCSSHGYSENQLILWKYPTMTKVKELTGHTERVLNMDMSPDGASVVSAAADETLRFWNVFGTPSCRPSSSALSMSGELSFGMPTIR